MIKEYKFIDKTEGEVLVPGERWGWIAIYKDGSYLKQFDEATGIFHQFREIAQDNLETFVMQSYEEETKRFEIHVTEGMKIIHFYRNTVFNMLTENETKVRTYVFGYEENKNGATTKTLLSIMPNDMLAITNQ